MTFQRVALLAVGALALGILPAASAELTRVTPSAAPVDRKLAETEFRRTERSVKQTLRSCAVARSTKERCSCRGQLKMRRAEVDQMKSKMSNIMSTLLIIMKEDIKQQNEEQKYYLEKLKEYNKMSKELSGHLKKFHDNVGQRCEDAGITKGPFGRIGVGRPRNPNLRRGPVRPAPIRPLAEQNTDRPGADYHDFDLSGADPAQCRSACARDARCKAWTFMKPGMRGPRAHCWLKNRVPPPRRAACCVSGVK